MREVPFETEEEWRYWWVGELNARGEMIRPPRMSEKEKDRYTAAESQNMIVAAGVTQLLNFVGSPNGNNTGFAQQLAFGNGALNTVNFSDTSLASEIFRLASITSNISGMQLDISALRGGGGSPTTITNVGLFGAGATGTLGSGTMMTKSLLSYTQPAASAQIPNVAYDYLLSYA